MRIAQVAGGAAPPEEDDSPLRWGVGVLVGCLVLSAVLLLVQNRQSRRADR